jgi:hypothetical protein
MFHVVIKNHVNLAAFLPGTDKTACPTLIGTHTHLHHFPLQEVLRLDPVGLFD